MGSEHNLNARRVTLAAGAVVVAVLVVGGLIWWGRPPQIGPDEEVARTVDALFTAITARDEKLLQDCEGRLHALNDAGRLPVRASDYLDGVIQKARDGGWEPAAEKLYGFMRAQQRASAEGHPPRRKERANPGPERR